MINCLQNLEYSITFDHICDFIPVVSAFKNLDNIFKKHAQASPPLGGAGIALQNALFHSRYYAHLDTKSYLDCALLIVPGLNILVKIVLLIKSACGQKRNDRISERPSEMTVWLPSCAKKTREPESVTLNMQELLTHGLIIKAHGPLEQDFVGYVKNEDGSWSECTGLLPEPNVPPLVAQYYEDTSRMGPSSSVKTGRKEVHDVIALADNEFRQMQTQLTQNNPAPTAEHVRGQYSAEKMQNLKIVRRFNLSFRDCHGPTDDLDTGRI